MTTSRETHATCTFVPPWLLERLGADATLASDTTLRTRREQAMAARVARPRTQAAPDQPAWTVHTAGNAEVLPGEPVRTPGTPESGDPAVDEAAAGISATLEMYAEGLGRSSYDDAGAMVSLTVHYGRDYDNAFWDGTQLVFGDGDGEIFERFTKPVDVMGHEFTHAVTELTAGLVYRGQSGALNESVSDVFAICLKQRLLGQDAASGSWLIGEELFLPAVQARGLRDMAAPGTAYDDPRLGQDPQPAHMDDFVVTSDDNGGVHINSGIPNRAFHLAATAIGGSSLEGAGRVWYAALTSGDVSPRADFAAFAAVTVAVAGEHADAVRSAWQQVGVEPGAVPSGTPAPQGGATGRVVRVRRSGGFAGRLTEGEVDLEGDDPRAAAVADLAGRVDLARVARRTQMPDMYVYRFEIEGTTAEVCEPLPSDLAELARLVLEER
ncbi:M4 family metallopeptidase [Nocardioides sp. Soil805]|uniref:M4 family metallopeptidase n=1 Tax=Nocardioides sp. Soil805 TaxID=1736416 RepID=UPI0007031428|nr:M4 family metallopeptidase [Nocardioides sp. Soil805]KRF35091.1 peptidase M4 [Nocardioides sp. Soil805]